MKKELYIVSRRSSSGERVYLAREGWERCHLSYARLYALQEAAKQLAQMKETGKVILYEAEQKEPVSQGLGEASLVQGGRRIGGKKLESIISRT